jgi:hypothetical protein
VEAQPTISSAVNRMWTFVCMRQVYQKPFPFALVFPTRIV